MSQIIRRAEKLHKLMEHYEMLRAETAKMEEFMSNRHRNVQPKDAGSITLSFPAYPNEKICTVNVNGVVVIELVEAMHAHLKVQMAKVEERIAEHYREETAAAPIPGLPPVP
jgi:hypothetical protein